MASNQNTLRAGDKIKLDGVLFSNSQTHCGMRRRGEWFISMKIRKWYSLVMSRESYIRLVDNVNGH